MAEKVETASDGLFSPEVVKTEEPSRDGTSSENRPSSPEPNCAICLSGPKNKSFTDTCVHQFCFSCLLEWSKVKAECPLCKQAFRCIIHNIRSLDDYDKYQVQPTQPALSPTSFIEGLNQMINDQHTRFRYRTTMGNNNHGGVSENLHNLFESLLNGGHHDDSHYHRSRYDAPGNFVLPTTRRQSARRNAFTGTSDFRRNIYRHNQWVRPAPDISGRYRESSPEFYRLNEAATHRLVPWLNRELNVLLSNNDYRESVMSMILRNITIYPIRSPEFYNLLTPYLGPHTRHFIHEFYSYAISQYDLIGYDSQIQYVSYPELGSDPVGASYDLSTSSDSDDSDVQVLMVYGNQFARENNGSNVSNSSVMMTLQSPHVSDDGNDSDCMVVEEVNPADRNIELIDVLSDSDDATPPPISIQNPGSNTVNVSSVCASSSDEDFCFIDEFPQVKNTTIPKLKVRDLREIVENPCLPSTSNASLENQRSSLKLKACARKARVSSLETSFFDTTDSGEEWRPTGSKTKRKKKKKAKCCCCQKLKKHWKKECLSCYNSNSESQSDLDSEFDSSFSDFSEHCKSLQKAFPCESSHCKSNIANSKKKSKSKRPCCMKPVVFKNCEYERSSLSSEDTDLSDGCFSAGGSASLQRQLRNKPKKFSATVDDHVYAGKKSLRNSKRKQATSHSSTRKLGKNKGRKHFKTHHNYESSTDSDSEEDKWYIKPKNTRRRISSTESECKPTPKKCKSRGKKLQTPRNSTILTNEAATPEFAGDYYIPKSEKSPAHVASPDSDLESNNSSGRPRLKSVVRVVNSTKKNADSLPHYEIVSSSISEPGPGPSTSRSLESCSISSLKINSKKKA